MLHIKNGTVYTMREGVKEILENTDILVDDGKIVKICPNLTAENAEVIDATGLIVTPGIIDAHSHVSGFTGEDQDDNEMTKPVTAECDEKYALHFDHDDFKHIVAGGVTTSLVIPGSANVIGGLGLVVKSYGDDHKKRIIKYPAVLKGAMGINPKGCYAKKKQRPMSRMGVYQTMKEFFLDCQDYQKAKLEGATNPEKMPKYDAGLENGCRVLNKEIPLKVHSYQHDMLTVIDIAKQFDIYVTLDHALGSSDFYDDIMDPHVKGVIFGPADNLTFGGEGCKYDPYCLKELMERGKLCAVMTDGPIGFASSLVNQIGEVVRWGLDSYEAFRMLTTCPAKILGVFDRVGSLEVGKDGDICLFDGVPGLDVSAQTLVTIIDGQIAYKR